MRCPTCYQKFEYNGKDELCTCPRCNYTFLAIDDADAEGGLLHTCSLFILTLLSLIPFINIFAIAIAGWLKIKVVDLRHFIIEAVITNIILVLVILSPKVQVMFDSINTATTVEEPLVIVEPIEPVKEEVVEEEEEEESTEDTLDMLELIDTLDGSDISSNLATSIVSYIEDNNMSLYIKTNESTARYTTEEEVTSKKTKKKTTKVTEKVIYKNFGLVLDTSVLTEDTKIWVLDVDKYSTENLRTFMKLENGEDISVSFEDIHDERTIWSIQDNSLFELNSIKNNQGDVIGVILTEVPTDEEDED